MKVHDVINFLNAQYPYKYYPNIFPKIALHDCAVVRFTGGTTDKNIKEIKSPSIQILFRTGHPKDGEEKSLELIEWLHGREHFYIGSTKVAFCISDQAIPIFVEREEISGKYIYSINFSLKIVEGV